MSEWYAQNIEPEIRKVVKLLRDNGFNTTSSCGHDMDVHMEWYDEKDEARLWNLLVKNGIKEFSLEIHTDKRSWFYRRYAVLTLPRPDGTYIAPSAYDSRSNEAALERPKE